MAIGLNGEIMEEKKEGDKYQFSRFDVVSDDSDHHYLKPNRNANCFGNAESSVYSKIMQEWKILEKNLPDSIFVRVYDRRIDLLRAVIVGAAGTPYHDGLFVFDIAFPSDYPNNPPMVYYHSFGLRLNPNLYSNGRVCLSLLNTWIGRKKEKWDPSQSTVLQILVSIQGLVLNEKPYFNEPGHKALPGLNLGEKNSMAYSESVFALSCKTMLFLLRNPPKNFESLIAALFLCRARFILEACNAYTHGCVKVGYYNRGGGGGDGGSSSSSSSSSSSAANVRVSTTFRTSMQMLFPDLIQSFTRNGASLGDFFEQVKQDREKESLSSSSSQHQLARKKQSIIFKAVSMLKKILGLKKRKKNNSVVVVVVAGSTESNKTETEG